MRERVLFGLSVAFLAAGCGDAGTSGSDGGDSIGSGSGGNSVAGVCSSDDYKDQVTAFCKTQNPPAPGPGELGASCVNDGQCDSAVCLEPFGNAAYCSEECPNGNECPMGYSCQDTGAGFAACYQDVCEYGGIDTSSCVSNLLGELDSGCNSSCAKADVEAWLGCISIAGRLCGSDDADAACGAERGILESCCLGCGSGIW